jgi:hypothetical protein
VDDIRLQSKLFQEFKSSGIEKILRSFLRAHIIRILDRSSPNDEPSFPPPSKELLHILANFLRKYKYTLTLSIFRLECGINNEPFMRDKDILRSLDIPEDIIEEYMEYIISENITLAESLLDRLKFDPYMEDSPRTKKLNDDDPLQLLSSLQQRLEKIDRTLHLEEGNAIGTLERVKLQKEYEEKYKKELELEANHY